MPKCEAMAQLSRPYQIALGVVALLGLVWIFALRGHSSNPSEPAPATPVASSPAPPTSVAAKPGAPSSVYHGSAPGVEGLTRAVAKAHEAVGTSEKNAQQLQSKSSAASGEPQASTTTTANKPAHKSAPQTAAKQRSSQSHKPGTTKKAHSGLDPAQVSVEHELTHGKTVMLLFWNPKSTVDEEVHSQARALASHSKQAVTLHVARANQVGMFGSITEVAHVYQTPTILIVNKHGVVSTLTGLTDVFSLEQAVREARKASA